MLTLLAYARYARFTVQGSRFTVWSYLLVVFLFALGLMSKPMLVTLPFVLLLMDYWPLLRFSSFGGQALERFRLGPETRHMTPEPNLADAGADRRSQTRTALRRIAEKLPLFAMSAASCLVTIQAQKPGLETGEHISLLARLTNTVVAYATYLKQTIWPSCLAVLYPHQGDGQSLTLIVLLLVLLASISAAVFILHHRHPYAMMGWLWFLGMLVPVIGLVQVGHHSHADRYMYLPQIGLFIALAWSGASLSARRPAGRLVSGSVVVLILAAFACCAWVQTTYWRDSISLWTRTLDCTSRNFLAHNNLGNALQVQGKIPEAIEHYRRSLRLNPEYMRAHNNLGRALASQGKLTEAIQHYRHALRINPDATLAHRNLGVTLQTLGKYADAIDHYTKALQLSPRSVRTLGQLGWLLATCPDASVRDGSKAMELAEKAVHLSGGRDPIILDTLAAAHAETGRYPEAAEIARLALNLATEQENSALADAIRIRLQLYETELPYRD